MSGVDGLCGEIFELLSEVTGGSLDGNRIGSDMEFTDTGMNSIEYLEFLDKVETRFGVVIDLEANGSLTSVDGFVDVLREQGVSL